MAEGSFTRREMIKRAAASALVLPALQGSFSLIDAAAGGANQKKEDSMDQSGISALLKTKKRTGTGGPLPGIPLVIGSYDIKGKANCMTGTYTGTCCGSPPCFMISLRKATYSYGNIMSCKAFTLNLPGRKYAVETDYFGIVSGRDTDKFKDTGLTAIKGEKVNAPIIYEFPVSIECALLHTYELGSHTLFIGEMVNGFADTAFLDADGRPVRGELEALVYWANRYCTIGENVADAFSSGKYLQKK